mmetsp:Transcript_38967/g.125176  ORF Transcript_38967/g.125176 Transcript_38967/m.125176 type:complete len:204 (-) Transcript_38967:882-1493(-)
MLHDSSNTGEAHVRRHWAGPAPGNCNPRMLHEGKFKLPSRPRHMPGDPSRPPSGMSCVTLAARNRRWSSERRAFDIVGRRDGEGIEDFLTLSASESRLVQRLGEVRKQRALAERCADVKHLWAHRCCQLATCRVVHILPTVGAGRSDHIAACLFDDLHFRIRSTGLTNFGHASCGQLSRRMVALIWPTARDGSIDLILRMSAL